MMRASLMKSVAAACVACAFAAQAAPVSVSLGGSFQAVDPAGSGQRANVWLAGGSATWTLSNGGWREYDDVGNLAGLVGAFNVGNVKVVGIGEVSPTEQLWADPFLGDVFRTGIQAPSKVGAVGLDNVTGQFISVTSAGVRLTGTRISGVLTGGTANLSNLRFDLDNKTVVADLSGVRSAVGTRPSINYSQPGTTLWTFASVTGQPFLSTAALTSANPAAAMAAAGFEVIDSTTFASTLTFSGLSITNEGFSFLVDSLGLGNTGRMALARAGDHGSIQARMIFSTAVPEPSTYALLGAGLLSLCIAARRRQTSKETS